MDTLKKVAEKLLTSDRPVVEKIFSANNTTVIAFGLKSGVELSEHTAPSRAKLVMIQGVVNFHINGEVLRFTVQDSFDIPLDIKHSVVGVEDAMFLIVLSQ